MVMSGLIQVVYDSVAGLVDQLVAIGSPKTNCLLFLLLLISLHYTRRLMVVVWEHV